MGDHMSERFERSAKPLSGTLGRLGHAANLAFRAGKERNQQVRFVKRIGAQNQSFRLLGHGLLATRGALSTRKNAQLYGCA